MRGEEEGKEKKLGEVKGWDVGRPYVLGRSAGVGGGVGATLLTTGGGGGPNDKVLRGGPESEVTPLQ